MSSIYVYSTRVYTIRRAVVLTLLFTIGFNEWRRLSLALFLLLTTIDPIVNTDSYSDIFVKRVRTVLLIELVLNLFLKAIVKQVYKPFIVDLGI